MGERRNEVSVQSVEDLYRRFDFRGGLILPPARKVLARRGGQVAAVRRERELPVPKPMRLHATRAASGLHIMPEQLAVVAARNERAPVREQHTAAGERLMFFLK